MKLVAKHGQLPFNAPSEALELITKLEAENKKLQEEVAKLKYEKENLMKENISNQAACC